LRSAQSPKKGNIAGSSMILIHRPVSANTILQQAINRWRPREACLISLAPKRAPWISCWRCLGILGCSERSITRTNAGLLEGLLGQASGTASKVEGSHESSSGLWTDIWTYGCCNERTCWSPARSKLRAADTPLAGRPGSNVVQTFDPVFIHASC